MGPDFRRRACVLGQMERGMLEAGARRRQPNRSTLARLQGEGALRGELQGIMEVRSASADLNTVSESCTFWFKFLLTKT